MFMKEKILEKHINFEPKRINIDYFKKHLWDPQLELGVQKDLLLKRWI